MTSDYHFISYKNRAGPFSAVFHWVHGITATYFKSLPTSKLAFYTTGNRHLGLHFSSQMIFRPA